MADLKTGTTVGGAGLWHASNLPLLPSGNLITYRGWRIYTEQDKPTADDVGALSLANGGTVANAVTLNKTLDVLGAATSRESNATYRTAVIRSDGAGAAYTSIIRADIKDLDTGGPSSETSIGFIAFRNGSNTTDPYGGKVLTQIATNWRTGGGGKMFLDARSANTIKARIIIDADTATTAVDVGTFQVGGATKLLGALTGTAATFSGTVTASGVYPSQFGNFDVRYVTSPPKVLPSSFTNMQDASITESSDIWTIASAMTDGPLSTSSTTVTGILVNYRRAYSAGAALVQTLYSAGMTYVRSGSGSPGAWTWYGSGINGWRMVYDTDNRPDPGDFNAVAKSGDTMTGTLNVPTLNVTGNTTLAATATLNNAVINGTTNFVGNLIGTTRSNGTIEITPTTDPASPATNSYQNTPSINVGWNTRGNSSASGATTSRGYVGLYGQEYVGNYWQGILNVMGYGSNANFYFRQDGILKAASLIAGSAATNSFGANSLVFSDNDSGFKGPSDGVIQCFAQNARVWHADSGQFYVDKMINGVGGITANNGNLYSGGSQHASDGNISGSRWGGGWLYDWLINNCMSDAGRGGQQYRSRDNNQLAPWESPAGHFLTGSNVGASTGGTNGFYFRQLIGRKISGGQFGLGDFA